MTVRHEHSFKVRSLLEQMLGQRIQMPLMADACVDEQRPAAGRQEIRVIARAGQQAWIVRLQCDRGEHLKTISN